MLYDALGTCASTLAVRDGIAFVAVTHASNSAMSLPKCAGRVCESLAARWGTFQIALGG